MLFGNLTWRCLFADSRGVYFTKKIEFMCLLEGADRNWPNPYEMVES